MFYRFSSKNKEINVTLWRFIIKCALFTVIAVNKVKIFEYGLNK